MTKIIPPVAKTFDPHEGLLAGKVVISNDPRAFKAKSILVFLKIKTWSSKITEQSIRTGAARANKADIDLVSAQKRLIKKSRLDKITALAWNGRKIFYRLTLPWDNYGTRLLPANLLERFKNDMANIQAQFQNEVDKFLKDYNQARDEMRNEVTGLGHLFRDEDYPNLATVRSRFEYTWIYQPLPDPTHIDVNSALSSDQVAEIRRSVEDQAKANIVGAVQNTWARLHDSVKKMADTLSKTDQIFRDSLVGNLLDVCDILPALNVTGDPRLDAACEEAKKLCRFDPETLRKDKEARSDAAKEADDLVNRLAGFMD